MITSRTRIAREAVASHYDELDHFYRDVWGDHVHHGLWRRGGETRAEAVLNLVDLVAERVGAAAGTRVCDIGCGYGATALVLAARGAEVTGITISPAQWAFAKRKALDRNNPQFVCGDWLQNDFAAESFDAAIAIESSEHMPDLRSFFAQAARVVKPGGRLIICAWLSADQPTRNAIRWLLEPICAEGRMPQLATSGEYQSLAEVAGFRSEQFEDIARGVEQTWPAIVRRLLVKFVSAPRYLRFLFTSHAENRVFALTIVRIWIAYRIGAMRYGVFTFVKC
ncbi:MAG: methyltransferase domain-containing protein [Chthoniobacterales bacterium]|nr:methyltransferase domain-containing protein [Chthoniobacterales bacterium]